RAPLRAGRGARSLPAMKKLEHLTEKAIRTLGSQPLLLLLVAVFFMNGMVRRVRRALPSWAIQAL
ncbi:MAG TPA: hypothetical protein PKH25_08735, partial [Syntrophales bacterium]|nr:hypothetical protein [Syntrophales bacterium]